MPEPLSRLNFDLSFLERVPASEGGAHLPQTKYKYNWRNIGIIAAIVVGGFYLIAASDGAHTTGGQPSQYSTPPSDSTSIDQSSSTNEQTPSDSTSVGQSPSTGELPSSDSTSPSGHYHCSQGDTAAADQLKPTDSKEALETAQEELEQRQNALAQLKNDIDASTTNDASSQSEVDDYNSKIEDYNSKLEALKADEQAFESRRSAFNAAVDAYNSYLQNHCGGQ